MAMLNGKQRSPARVEDVDYEEAGRQAHSQSTDFWNGAPVHQESAVQKWSETGYHNTYETGRNSEVPEHSEVRAMSLCTVAGMWQVTLFPKALFKLKSCIYPSQEIHPWEFIL